jgi:hypothetical protein
MNNHRSTNANGIPCISSIPESSIIPASKDALMLSMNLGLKRFK